MDYFPLGNTAPQTVILCNNKLFFGNKWDYYVVFTMWFCYIALSILFLLTVNQYVIENYSLGLGIFSYFLSLPGIYYAIACFSTDPGIVKRGDIVLPENIENDNPHPYVQDNGIIDSNPKESEEMKVYNKSNPEESTKEQQNELESDQQNNKNLLEDDQEENEENKQEQESKKEKLKDEVNNTSQQQTQQTQNRGNLLKERYCKTCKIMRPPLASHCSHCNNCVKTFDHHCFFMGNCIGERNQKYFVLFLICTAVWSIYAEIFTVINTIEAIQTHDTLIYDLFFNEYLFYPFCILGVLSILTVLMRCHQCIKGWLFLAFLADVGVITLYSYIQNTEVAFIDNPIISIIMCGVYVGVILFVLPQACFNTSLACKSLTQKQEVFFSHPHTHDIYYSKQKPSFSNFWNLITKPQIKSEILS